LDAAIPGWVNDTYQEVLARYDWSFLSATAERETVAGTYRYALPGDFREVRIVILDDGTSSLELPVFTNEKFDHAHPDLDSEAAGTPAESTIIYGVDDTTGEQYSEVWLAPPPNAVFTLRMRYYINYGNLSGTDTPRFPARFHQLLVYGGTELGMARLREYQASQFWMGKKEVVIASMLEDDRRMPRDLKLGTFTHQTVYPSDYHKKWWIRSVR
jgi:hypothetical protein